jgi:hypothetical protein
MSKFSHSVLARLDGKAVIIMSWENANNVRVRFANGTAWFWVSESQLSEF